MHLVQVAREAILTHNALQKGAELASFLALAMDVNPRTVVEIGADTGGTLWAWQQLGCRVVAVTLPDGPYGSAARVQVNDHGCEVIYGDSHDPETVARLEQVLAGTPVDVLFIDGDHTFQGVKSDFEMYRHLVRPGGLIAFHDICDHPDWPDVKVKAFWDTVEWDGRREAIVVTEPWWGGIGVLHVPAMAEVSA
jgi:cephalosporin hydroxylase